MIALLLARDVGETHTVMSSAKREIDSLQLKQAANSQRILFNHVVRGWKVQDYGDQQTNRDNEVIFVR